MEASIKALLLDIEGTITSINFVKDELFGYVRSNLHNFVDEKWQSDLMERDVADMRKWCKSANKVGDLSDLVDIPDGNTDETKQAFIQNVQLLMQHDMKVTPLKTFQGHMWHEAYSSGVVKGHLYSDVVPVLEKLSAKGKKIYIYSSGSVGAQILLFTYSCDGDITRLLSGYFDTTTGPKIEPKSYQKIANEISIPVADILFLTDLPREANAAKDAGCQVIVTKRQGNAPLDDETKSKFTVITSLDELLVASNENSDEQEYVGPPPKAARMEKA